MLFAELKLLPELFVIVIIFVLPLSTSLLLNSAPQRSVVLLVALSAGILQLLGPLINISTWRLHHGCSAQKNGMFNVKLIVNWVEPLKRSISPLGVT